MSRLIDADALTEDINNTIENSGCVNHYILQTQRNGADHLRNIILRRQGGAKEGRNGMNEPITPEQSKKLLQAIFAEEDTDEDNYPETIADQVSYSEYVLTHNLQYIGKAIDRLSRLSRLLLVAERHENGLPDIITNNELRMALEPLLRVREDINEITDYLLESYRATKPKDKKSEMREGERSCENCGDTRCANSAVAYNWDECVDSNFTKHWVPKKGGTA